MWRLQRDRSSTGPDLRRLTPKWFASSASCRSGPPTSSSTGYFFASASEAEGPAVGAAERHDGQVSRWGLLDYWERDLPGLTLDQLHERLTMAKDYEAKSMRRGMARNPKAARDWRRRRSSVEAELARRPQLNE